MLFCISYEPKFAHGDPGVGLPFIFNKYIIQWWLLRDGGKRIHQAEVLMPCNMACMLLAMVVNSWFDTRGPGGIYSAYTTAIAFTLLTLQSHFYCGFRLRWLLWALYSGHIMT